MNFKIIANTRLHHTPARVNMKTGVCEYNPKEFEKIPKNLRNDFFQLVMCHEWAHYHKDTRDELKADSIGFQKYIENGGSVRNAVAALTYFLDSKIPFHRKRIQQLFEIAKKADKTHFIPYQNTHNLQNNFTRKNIMRKHRYANRRKQLRELQVALQNKAFDKAKGLLGKIKNEETEEKYLGHLARLERGLNLITKPANFLGPDGEDVETLACLVGETADHMEAMEGNESDKLSFNGDEFENMLGDEVENNIYDLFSGLDADTADFVADLEETESPFANLGGKAKAKRAEKKAAKQAAKDTRQQKRNETIDAKNAIRKARAESKVIAAANGTTAAKKEKLNSVFAGLGSQALKIAGNIGVSYLGAAGAGNGTDILPEEKGENPTTLVETTPGTTPDEKKPLLPVWAWIVIAVVVLGMIGGGAWYFMRKKK